MHQHTSAANLKIIYGESRPRDGEIEEGRKFDFDDRVADAETRRCVQLENTFADMKLECSS